jgi:hypothetical protein
MKKRFTIYINSEVWDKAKMAAYQKSAEDISNPVSASQFVETAILSAVAEPMFRLDLKPENHQEAIGPGPRVELRRGDSYTDDEIRAANDRLMEKREAAAQLKLDEKRKGRNIKKDKIDQVRATVNFNPQPKKSGK